jgi:cyclohexa-1,5-dienecarbonyl-CoA hydratase
MLQEFEHALKAIGQESAYRFLIIRGEGKCFSAGMEVSDHLPDKVELMLSLTRKTLAALVDLEIPTLAAIHGSALGGGLEIALTADLTYAVAGTKLGQPEIKLGVFPPVAVAHYPDWIGYKRTAEMVFTGRIFEAEEALQSGLINGVFSNDDFANRIEEIAKVISSYSRPVLAATKQALRKTSRQKFLEKLELAEKIYLERLMKTDDAIEGLNAFLEKRKPQWKQQ